MTKVEWAGAELKVSNSEVQVFKDCRRKWWVTYYRELAPVRPELSGPLALGTKIHLVLERDYEGLDEGDATGPLAYLDELYLADVETLKDHPFGEDAAKELRKEWDLAKAMVEGFVEWRMETGLDSGLQLIDVEAVIEVPSHVPGVTLRGKVDQKWLRESDGRLLFRDWKTTASFTDRQLLVMNEQMAFYHLLVFLQAMQSGGEAAIPDGALYTMLRKVKRTAAAKPPFYMEEEVRHNRAQLESIWKRTARVVEEIVRTRQELDAGSDHLYVAPPRPSRDCTWKCPHYAVCPLFDDGSDAERALAENYTHQDPHERYTREEEEKR